MSNFLSGVLASLVAALIAFLVLQVKTRAVLSWGTFSLFWSLAGRLKKAGISNLFPTRSSYPVYRKERSVTDYVLTARREIIYVGFWLAEGIEIGNILGAMRTLIARGHTVELVLLTEDLDIGLQTKFADYLAISVESLHSRLSNAWKDARHVLDGIPHDLKTRFILRSHAELLTASAFVFDYGTESAKTLVDFKFYGAGRAQSFGIELKPDTLEDSLYSQATNSFLTIKRRSVIRN